MLDKCSDEFLSTPDGEKMVQGGDSPVAGFPNDFSRNAHSHLSHCCERIVSWFLLE